MSVDNCLNNTVELKKKFVKFILTDFLVLYLVFSFCDSLLSLQQPFNN